jgi:hypothetical protein
VRYACRRIRSRVRPADIRTLLPRLTWLDVRVRIVGPDPASFTHMGSDTEIRRRCHLIDTFILERVHEKS